MHYTRLESDILFISFCMSFHSQYKVTLHLQQLFETFNNKYTNTLRIHTGNAVYFVPCQEKCKIKTLQGAKELQITVLYLVWFEVEKTPLG